MSTIVVIRGSGDRKGQDIIDPLLYTLEAKLARGAAEMDTNAHPQQVVDLEVVYRPGIRTGMLVEVLDALQGAAWRGKITGIAHTIDNTSVFTKLSVLRHSEAFQ